MPRMHADELSVDADLVRQLLRAQFPSLAALPLAPVASWGTDHAIWRLGEDVVLRFPRIGWAAAQPEHEARVLRRLAPELPVAVPEPIALGRPDHRFPFPWAVHRWLPVRARSCTGCGLPRGSPGTSLGCCARSPRWIPAARRPPPGALSDFGTTRPRRRLRSRPPRT